MSIISVIQALAALYVLVKGISALNRMGPATQNLVRLSYIALVTGAAAAVISTFASRDIFECVFAVGVALYMATNRRKAKT
jgi:hypothetical protein